MSPDAQKFKRYALYFVAGDSDLSRFGVSWLGWDTVQGKKVKHPELDLPIADITQTPRRYGFHGTIVPPFRSETGVNFVQIVQIVRVFCTTCPAIRLERLELAQLGRFLALVPVGGTGELTDLAAAALTALDPVREAPSEADLERHRAKGLSETQERLLTRWGYPHVMEAFRFHMTLTGKLPKAEARTVKAVLEPLVTPLIPAPFVIDALALMGEDADGYFHVIERFTLTG